MPAPRGEGGGADAVLLIVAALRPVELKVLHDHARRYGLDALVEVHDATELAIAIDAGADHRRQQPQPADAGSRRPRLGGTDRRPGIVAISGGLDSGRSAALRRSDTGLPDRSAS
jgi:hypothetical protein